MARSYSTKDEAGDFTLHLADASWDRQQIIIALLADIRRSMRRHNELLVTLNATLQCYRVRRGMDALHSIDRRLAKKIPHRKRKAKSSG